MVLLFYFFAVFLGNIFAFKVLFIGLVMLIMDLVNRRERKITTQLNTRNYGNGGMGMCVVGMKTER